MGHRRAVWRETSAGALASAAATAVSFLIVPVTTRALGVGAWGSLATATAWAAFLATLFHLSLNQVALHRLSRPEAAGTAPVVLGSTLSLAALGSALAVLAGLAVWVATGGAAFRGVPLPLLAAALATVPGTLWTTVAQGLFQAQGRVLAYAGLSVVAALVSAGGILALAAAGRLSAYGVLAAYVVAGLAFAAVSVALLLRWVGRPQVSGAVVKGLLRGSAVLHWSAIGYFVFSTSDILMVASLAGAEEVAWYRLASLVLTGILLLPAAMTSSFFAMGGRLGADAAWPLQRRLMWQLTLVVAAGCALAYPFIPAGIRLLAGPSFAPAADLVRILLLALPGLMASALFAPQWILRGLFWQATALTLANGALNLLLNLWWVPRWGAAGAAWARVACAMVALAVNLAAAVFLFRPRPAATEAAA